MDTDILKEAAASVIRVDVCKARNCFCYKRQFARKMVIGEGKETHLVQVKGHGMQTSVTTLFEA
jgi:hypothetical protein